MPRTLTPAALAKLAQNIGTEPITIIEVQWTPTGNRLSYADRDIATGISGVIQSVGGLDNVALSSNESQSSQSAQITVVLSDTDGSLKAIFDANDIHKRPVWIYQWFQGLALTDKFLIVKGMINSTVTWKEGDRTLSFTVISQVEDVEVGFSIEEGDFWFPSPKMIGKAWPLCFGTCVNVPALPISTDFEGELATGIGIADPTLPARIDLTERLECPFEFKGYSAIYDRFLALTMQPLYGPLPQCTAAKCRSILDMQAKYAAQLQFQYNSFVVFNGEKFPQDVPLSLEINSAIFDGFFVGALFNITNRTHPFYAHPAETHGVDVFVTPASIEACRVVTPFFLPEAGIPPIDPNNITGSSESFLQPSEALALLPKASFFWADPGAKVVIKGLQTVYIASIIPATIIRVTAHRQQPIGQVLVTVPSEFYTIRQTDYTGYQVMEIVFDQPLSSRGIGWTDEVFVTLTSTVGPNTVDILTWLIQTYSTHGIDSVSFDHVRPLIDNYPMHFALLTRKPLLQVLQEIAYQARCTLSLIDDIFVIKYLAEDPPIDDTIVASDVLANTMEIFLTETEKLVTKYVASWRPDYEVVEKNDIIFLSNVAKYGVHSAAYDYYCFNIVELVRKAATFWLIRLANTWKKVRFSAPLSKLTLEIFDCAGVTLPEVGNGQIKAIVEQANYDPATQAINFELWTPIRAGEMTPYIFAYPADVSELDVFPTLIDRQLGLAGVGTSGGPNFITRAPPIQHPLSNAQPNGLAGNFSFGPCGQRATISDISDPNIRCSESDGDKKPSDRKDKKPNPNSSEDAAGAQGGVDPPATPDPACCGNASDLAQQALDAANQVQAAMNTTPQPKPSSSAPEDNTVNPGGQGPDSTLAKKLPPCTQPAKCNYVVQNNYIIPDQIHHHVGDVPFAEDTPGATGFVSTSHPGGTETYTVNSFAAAKALFTSMVNQWQAAVNNGTYVVGQRGPAGPTAVNFRPTDTSDTACPTNPPVAGLVCYSDNRT